MDRPPAQNQFSLFSAHVFIWPRKINLSATFLVLQVFFAKLNFHNQKSFIYSIEQGKARSVAHVFIKMFVF